MGFLLTPIDLNQDQNLLVKAAESWAESFDKVNHLTYINKMAGSMALDYLPDLFAAPAIEGVKEDLLQADRKRVNELISASAKSHCKGFALAGTPSEIIKNLIDSHEYEMVMVGHDYEKYKDSFFTGSTTDQIIRTSDRPIAIIRNEKSLKPKSIATLVDFSHDVDKLTKNIEKIAKAFEAKVTFIHVAPHYLNKVSDALTTNTGLNAMLSETENMAKIHAEKECAKILDHFKSQNIEADTVILSEKISVEDTIEKYLKKNSFDLVAMGAHSHNAIERFFLGSVSYQIVHKTNNNILLIK